MQSVFVDCPDGYLEVKQEVADEVDLLAVTEEDNKQLVEYKVKVESVHESADLTKYQIDQSAIYTQDEERKLIVIQQEIIEVVDDMKVEIDEDTSDVKDLHLCELGETSFSSPLEKLCNETKQEKAEDQVVEERQDLQNLERRENERDKFPCHPSLKKKYTACRFTDNQGSYLNKQMSVCTGGTALKCKVCNESFTLVGSLLGHKNQDAMEDPANTTGLGVTDPGPQDHKALPAQKDTLESIKKNSNQIKDSLTSTFSDLTQTGVTALLKLYIAPFPQVMPQLGYILPYQTEKVRSLMNLNPHAYTPWAWMEPVRVRGLTYDYPAGGEGAHEYEAGQVATNLPDLAYSLVNVNRVLRNEMATPALSTLAATLRSFLNSDLTLYKISQQRALQPARFQKDLQARILTMAPKEAVAYYDEAPMLRLALLTQTLVTPIHLDRCSSIVQQTLDNCVPTGPAAVAWAALPNDNTPGCRQPNVAPGTVDMYAVGLDVYTQIASGAWENRNVAWENIPLSQTVVVPIMSTWSGQEWLIPYILSFTTTSWWNFARTATFNNIGQRTQGAQLEHAQLRGLIEACTVVVPGRHNKILLVIVDKGSETYGPAGQFWIRQTPAVQVPVFTGQAAGVNFNGFATAAYTWLGRMGANAGNMASLSRAWREMCATVAMPGMAQRVLSMTAELCYTRAAPYIVTPGNIAGGGRRFDGPWALGQYGTEVDRTDMARWDIDKHVAADALALLRAKATLRHSASGIYPSSAIYIGSGAQHAQNIPCFNSDRYLAPQYEVNQAEYTARIAIACGLFVSACGGETFTCCDDMALYCQGLSGLMLGVSGWIYGRLGLSTTANSGYFDMANFAPSWVSSAIPTATDSFVLEAIRYGERGFGQEHVAAANYNVGLLLQLYYRDPNIQNPWDYANLNVPWWYVSAVQQKLGFSMKPAQRAAGMQLSAGLGGGRQLVYKFGLASQWSDKYTVMSDPSYEENHWLFAAQTEMDAGLAIKEMFWYPDAYYDLTRQGVAAAAYAVQYPVPATGVIGITMTGGDYTSQYRQAEPSLATWQRSLVWGDTQVDLQMPETVPFIVGGLRYPDPFWDWLREGAKKVDPHQLVENWGQAALEGFKHLAEPATTWAGDKIKTWVDARSE